MCMLVYIVRNRFNDKVYVGKHKGNNLQRRWKRHIRSAETGSQTHFHRAIRKYGADNFWACLLSNSASSIRELNEQERFYIAKYRANDTPFGYNMTTGGEWESHPCPWKGRKLPEAWRKSLSAARKGKKFSEAHRLNLAASLKKVARRGVESPRFGKPLTDEVRGKISQSKRGKPSNRKGIKLTDEHKKRIGDALRGRKRVFSKEWRENMRLSALGNQNAKGTVHSDRWKNMMSEKMKGNKNAKRTRESI